MGVKCKAKGRVSKKPCGNSPVTGRAVCRMHGGATPRGTESPHFKHGLYSRYAAPALAARIDELRQDEERLHDLREVMALQGALLGEALQQDDLGAAVALTEAVSRSIHRYLKHHPPEGSLEEIKIKINQRQYVSDDPKKLTDEQVDARLEELLVIVGHGGNPKQDTGTGNP